MIIAFNKDDVYALGSQLVGVKHYIIMGLSDGL